MNWSTYQTNIFDNVISTESNIAVKAVAGSGKTTTLVEVIHNLTGTTLFSAFNKHIATELQTRIGDIADAKTLHSAGMGLLSNVRKVKVDNNKYYAIIKKLSAPHFHKSNLFLTTKVIKKVLGMTMKTLTQPEDFEAMLMTYGFLTEILELSKKIKVNLDDLTRTIQSIVYESIEAGIKEFEETGLIDFDDMIYIPVIKGLTGKYKNVLIDEAQDLNASQMELALNLSKQRIISVADPRQSIMGFTGALPDSYDRIISSTKANILPLSVCYRCPTSHIWLAQDIVPDIQPAPNAKVGEIHRIKTDEVFKLAEVGDLIICRRNAPLISLALKFIANRRQARVRGRDFGTDLILLAETVNDYDTIIGSFREAMIDKLRFYQEDKNQILAKYDNAEQALEALADRCECLRTIIESSKAKNIAKLCNEISNLFDDDKTAIYLSSVHRAKGLEADNVFVIDYDRIRIAYKGQNAWQAEQEANLEYVALTRAKQKLYLVVNK